MRLLTKAEACRELEVSMSTLNRRIATGEVRAKQESRGRRHRVYVMLDDEPPQNASDVAACEDVALAVALEQIRGLEEQLEFCQEQLELEQQRNAGLVNDLKTLASPEHGRAWWGLWRRRKG